ncbi:TetR/AcrR family transcriptional regulator [Patulibacter defluvii]|uniref:TetR/AcrR family transcriptional regulator n=1 Tax=Patulibacter defluvii TaxID=3095358 RepID=UPI002A74908F|nr:TetR/AcrR family transcriptional regulator [Patulibacter sp. DM4]
MASPSSTSSPRRGPQPQKREAIARAARRVFGRDGYARAGIDAIAAEAAVSTRTIYKHFGGKQALFAAVLEESAGEVAEGFDAFVADGLREAGDDVERTLTVLGRAMVRQRTAFPEHFAMIRQINAEAPHFPPAVIEAWQQAGPLRVQRRITVELERLAAAGRLRLDDPERATRHLVALVTADLGVRSYAGGPPLDARATEAMVVSGVRAFLDGYRSRG